MNTTNPAPLNRAARMKAAQTKGPWRLVAIDRDIGLYEIHDANNCCLFQTIADTTTPEAALANALLVSAAPELDEAIYEVSREYYGRQRRCEIPEKIMSNVRYAAEKARGLKQ